jgi:hypothetical protein
MPDYTRPASPMRDILTPAALQPSGYASAAPLSLRSPAPLPRQAPGLPLLAR